MSWLLSLEFKELYWNYHKCMWNSKIDYHAVSNVEVGYSLYFRHLLFDGRRLPLAKFTICKIMYHFLIFDMIMLVWWEKVRGVLKGMHHWGGILSEVGFLCFYVFMSARNYVKLEMILFVMNFNRGAMLGGSQGDCRPATQNYWKNKRVKTKTVPR